MIFTIISLAYLQIEALMVHDEGPLRWSFVALYKHIMDNWLLTEYTDYI